MNQASAVSATRNDPQGSLWRKWDLHVHTPASLVSRFGGDTNQVWNSYIQDLAALPPEIEVLGINDYIFLDGYKRVKEAWENGKLPNIKLLLPVVELRVDKFGGTEAALRRVNYHVIFSDEVPVHAIEEQFIMRLRASYRLEPTIGNVSWEAAPTRSSLEDLGNKIIASVPAAERKNYNSPLVEGFNNFNVTLDSIHDALESHFLRYAITAVGKTEWAAIKWQDGSIAEKKTVINGAGFVFVAAESPDAALKARDALKQNQVNARLLDCSDAHALSSSADKDRIGNCCTWLKADPTFEGLRLVMHEPDNRIFLGATPPQVHRKKVDPTRILSAIEVRKRSDAKLGEVWFDGQRVPLNPGLVSIIGRKGSGKSALLDILALGGDSQRQKESSFLTRFAAADDNKAASFEAQISWVSGPTEWVRLDGSPGPIEKLTYIPQRLFEDICNELAGEERGRFDGELKRVIFAHVAEVDRLGRGTAEEWLDYRSHELRATQDEYRKQLRGLNRDIVAYEEKLHGDYGQVLEAEIARRTEQLRALQGARPIPVDQPPTSADEAQEETRAQLQRLVERRAGELRDGEAAALGVAGATNRLAAAERLRDRLARLERTIEQTKVESLEDAALLGLDIDTLIRVAIDLESVRREAARQQLAREEGMRQADPTVVGSLAWKVAESDREIELLQKRLDAPALAYQQYLQAEAEWAAAIAEITGSADIPQSLGYFLTEKAKLEDVPARLKQLEDARRELCVRIGEAHAERAGLLRKLYGAIQAAIEADPIAKERVSLVFTADVEDAGFTDAFLNLLHQGRVGSFSGKEEGETRVRAIIARHDLTSPIGMCAFAEEIVSTLRKDLRDAAAPDVAVKEQLRRGVTVEDVYDLVFGLEYLEPRYGMQFGGRPIHLLSPGEKGALLLVFYLLLDPATEPLLIDQPEENLDNETVFDLLVPAIRHARNRRQVVVVTHNPNLAIACDADQVICAERDPANGNRVTYVAGAIENPMVKQRAINILEGTLPAFRNRSWKYDIGATIPSGI